MSAKKSSPLLFLLGCALAGAPLRAADFDVRAFGATGNGKTIDSPAINQAIEAAAAAGGGTVRFPAGTYLSFSIRLKSHITLHLEPGSIIEGATPSAELGAYDPPEPNEWGDKQYQDYGHSHFHNSLIWGDALEDIAITGTGRIFGKGLSRANGGGGGGGRRGGQGPGGQGPNGTDAAGPNGTLPPGASAAAAAPVAAGATPAAGTPPGGPGARVGGGGFGLRPLWV